MSQTLRMFAIALVCVALAACSGQQERDQDDNTGMNGSGSDNSGQTSTSGMDDGDDVSVDPFEDPDSLLSKRVVYFDFDSSDVRAEYREIVRAHAKYLSENSSARVTLEGHADERGTREYNLGLGERRGDAVSELLRARGASSNQLSVVSYGEERPVCTQSTDRCWERNRRVEIVYTAR